MAVPNLGEMYSSLDFVVWLMMIRDKIVYFVNQTKHALEIKLKPNLV